MTSRVTVSSTLGRRRLATLADAAIIYELLNESMAKNFRIAQISDINALIETSILSVVQMNQKDTVVGFLAVKDYPLLPALHPSAWEHYIWTKYKTVDMTARNTLFLHLLCWEESYGRDVVDEMLRSLFMHDPYLMNVAMIKSLPKFPLLMPGQSRCEGSFKRVTTAERGVPAELLPVLCIAERSDVCPRLRVRRAVEEDNDDLVPIIHRHSARLRQLYGEFYISELISRHPESERVMLVGEHKELAVGVMILNTIINYEALEESFDLSPFAGLRHLAARPYATSSKEVSAASSLDAGLSVLCYMSDILRDCTTREKADQSFKKTLCWLPHGDLPVEQSWNRVPVSLPLDDDEEEIDFDIVNIDKTLLTVPRSLSVDIDADIGSTNESLQGSTKDVVASIPDQKVDQTVKCDHQNKADQNAKADQNCKRDQNINKLKKVLNSDRNLCGPTQSHDTVRYSGTPNAFVLEVFAMHPDYDERRGFDLLQAAFEMFPGRDYCLLCLPSNQPAFPLLEHFTLVAPKQSREKFFSNQSLYVAHINSVRECVAVRPAEPYDLASMTQILEHVPVKQMIYQLMERSFVRDGLDAYILLSQHQAVGVVIVGSLDNGIAVRTQYDLEPEPRSPDTDGAILAGILSPALEPHSRWYLRDILRYSKYTHLFWLCHLMAKGSASSIKEEARLKATSKYPSRNIMSLAGRMVPVLPHRRFTPNITGNKNLDKVWNTTLSFALWGIEGCLTALPKVDVNNGIVVVGASRTGLAFIEALLMGPAAQYLTFTNVTLVSEHGLPMVSDCLPAAETCFPCDGRYTNRYLKSIPFYFYVDCITGVMVGIDRKKKCIHLKGGGVKYYDELVLTCGKQYQHPDYLAESFAYAKKMKKGQPCERTLMDDPTYRPGRVPSLPDLPDNVFVINSLYEATNCLRRLLCMINTACSEDRLSSKNKVIVYGDCLQSYSTIAALLEMGVLPAEIAFVEPFPSTEPHAMRVNCFNNEVIDERVQARIEELGVFVYRECRFVKWRMMGCRVHEIELMAPLHCLNIPCFGLFYYGLKAINFYAFKAISECGLVYDGGLMIDPLFKTNDPHVYGAGTCTQYSRRLHAERYQHRYYCPEDVGEALANIFLAQMDPFVMADPELESDVLPRYRSSLLNCFPHPSIEPLTRPSLEKHRKWEPVIQFETHITSWTVLPGPLYYMRVRRPGPDIPMEVALSLPHQGHLLTTDKDGNYFGLQLNELHCIESVTCLAKKPPCFEILNQIYGVHESIFNKLLCRYMLNKIEDFYEYFMQPWLSAAYQEGFGNMLRQICRQNVGTVFDLVKSHFTLDVIHDKDLDDDRTEQLMRDDSDISVALSSVFGCYSAPNCVFGPGDAPNLGTVHSVIARFLQASIASEMHYDITKDFPSECGQSEQFRSEAKGFWTALGADRIVMAHLARYLHRNNVPNPHYAKIRTDLI